MLEQSQINGPIYYSQEIVEKAKYKLVSKPVVIKTLKFGPPTKIIIHLNTATSKVLLEILKDDSIYPEYYLYNDNKFCQKLHLTESDTVDDRTYAYFYGIAKVDGVKSEYFIKNEPNSTIEDMPTFKTFQLPPVISGYSYNQKFSYIKDLNDLIGDLKATFTDRYKRPLNARAMQQYKYFPVIIDNVTTIFRNLSSMNYNYPIVVVLNESSKPSKFGCVDLEPHYTPEDLKLAESFDAYYVEDTPRGGKHYLVRVAPDNTTYKYRVSPHIEVQIQCQITIYGINGHMLNSNPEISDFSKYPEVHHTTNNIKSLSDIADTVKFTNEIEDMVTELRDANTRLGSTGEEQAKRAYIYDNDDSHADFTAMARLYRLNIKPLKDNFTNDDLPWILASYAMHVIPPRAKHQDSRNGVPYLVYIADKIIN